MDEARWLHARGSARDRLDERLAAARAPQRDFEARRLMASARAVLFGGERRTSVARYQLHEVLGRGGAGVVYRARDPELDRPLAIKVVRPDGGSESALVDLVREARAIAALAHPNVVEVYDTGRVDDEVYIAMELIEGEPLDAWLRVERTWAEIREVLVQAGRGLAHAHAAGIVHRDFKPGNVIVGRDAYGVRVRVVDFGLAKLLRSDPGDADTDDAVAGTPAYMAPEQALGRQVDARSDEFSFCVVAFEALHGQRPFTGRTLAELVHKLDEGAIEAVPTVVSVPRRVERAIRRGLSRTPEARWPDMLELLAELDRRPRRRRWLALSLVGVGIAAIAWRGDEAEPVCASAEGGIAGAWGPQRAAEVHSSIASMPALVGGAQQWTRIEAELDAYGQRWSSAYDGVCSVPSTAADPRVHQRLRCLEHRLETLRALVDLLETADAKAISTALEAVRSLPDVETCLHDAVESSFPAATSPEQVATFARIEELLAEGGSRILAGQYERAIGPLSEAVNHAELVGSRTLAARALHQLGNASRGRGEFEAAADHAMAAFWHAMAASNDQTAIASAILLVAILGHDLGQFEHAERWARQARALLPRASDPIAAEFLLEEALAQAELLTKREDRAAVHLLRALELADELPEGAPGRGVLHLNLANVYESRGEVDEAMSHHRLAQEHLLREVGPLHPELANARANFGVLLIRMGRREEAVLEFEAAIEAADATGSGAHPMAGMAHSNLGLVQLQLRSFDQARVHLERALEIVSATLPPTHPYLGMIYANLGEVAAETGDADAAREDFGRAAVILAESVGAEDPMLAKLTKMRADVERDAGNFELATALYEQALDLLEGVQGQDDTRAEASAGLAHLQRNRSNRDFTLP